MPTETTAEPLTKVQKFRAWVKRNKTKIVAGFAALVSVVAGDSGVIDGIRTLIFGA